MSNSDTIIYTRSELASLAHSFYTCIKHGINYAKEKILIQVMWHTYTLDGSIIIILINMGKKNHDQ